MAETPRRALILDRDGVVNYDPGYLHRIEDCRFIPGIFDLAHAFAAQGFAIVIATNQAGIGRGYYGEKEFWLLMDWMRGEFARHGAPLSAVYFCPYHPTEAIGEYRRESSCRKPGPGMLLQAAADLNLDLTQSWCVGDKLSDIEAGRTAGVRTLVLLDSDGQHIERRDDYWVAPDLPAITVMFEKTIVS
jgi:D-glycero-D-manno-heptose 1,7-bisphosphate phosphatase